ncbi:hypothetical protein OLEAN_C10470 [Oleispira antarctica RB-8]|uniref:Uncharacterized protein n=1 Tax=Oleispira antarctica RB-8 TaxID=698738 RepID=R4YPP1_OLEAN|nr:hypothetical protein OLEAN_C10470 [Oleispira antarctica RB-8]
MVNDKPSFIKNKIEELRLLRCPWRCIGLFVVGASFRREAKYEPTGRAKRRIHGVPRNEQPNATREKAGNYGVFQDTKSASIFFTYTCVYTGTYFRTRYLFLNSFEIHSSFLKPP